MFWKKIFANWRLKMSINKWHILVHILEVIVLILITYVIVLN